MSMVQPKEDVGVLVVAAKTWSYCRLELIVRCSRAQKGDGDGDGDDKEVLILMSRRSPHFLLEAVAQRS